MDAINQTLGWRNPKQYFIRINIQGTRFKCDASEDRVVSVDSSVSFRIICNRNCPPDENSAATILPHQQFNHRMNVVAEFGLRNNRPAGNKLPYNRRPKSSLDKLHQLSCTFSEERLWITWHVHHRNCCHPCVNQTKIQNGNVRWYCVLPKNGQAFSRGPHPAAKIADGR